MKKNLLSTAIATAMLSAGMVGTASAHDILNGVVAAGQSDWFRTQCFAWGDGFHDAAAPTGEVTGDAAGYRFAINLQSKNYAGTTTYTSSLAKATVWYVTTGNVNNFTTTQNNVLPDSPAAQTVVATDTGRGNPWNIYGAQPDFNTDGSSQGDFGPSAWVALPTANGGSVDYLIVVSGSATKATGYDFVGHCQNAATGVTSLIHTGQGTWFSTHTTDGVSTLAPTSDYDQLQDN